MGRLWDLVQRHIDEADYPPSERELAKKLGVTHTALRYWREPKAMPSRQSLEAIARLIGVRYSVVLDAALYDTGYHEAAQVIPLRRPLATVESELEVARQNLAEFDELSVTGRSAGRKRAELKAAVDALEAERISSRRATGEHHSVAES